MKKTGILILLLCSVKTIIFAQEKTQDSLLSDPEILKTVVLTGQYHLQSVDKSVVEVEVITQEDIKRMAGNTLGDVLNQTLNLSVIPNAGEGRSGIEQFGFNSEYIKILVDGVPIVGDEGFGSAIDVSQIHLDDIQQIEIVEGAMGVQYGSNAVTGVINIITKKKSYHTWQITPYVQEETIGSEYGWFDKGRHIQSIKIGHNITDRWYADITYARNDFKGFLNQKQGKTYYNPMNANDGLRGYEWLPKTQNTSKGLVNYKYKGFSAFYKFEYFDEQTEKYGNNIHLNTNPATQTNNPTANDVLYRTKRLYHHFNATGNLFQKYQYNLSVSYQEQTRNQEAYTYYLNSKAKTNIDRFDYNTRNGFYSRGTLNRFFDNSLSQLSLGYEVNADKGTASGLSEQDAGINSKDKVINTHSVFASSEIRAFEKLSLSPGFRYTYSSVFKNQYALSVSSKYNFHNGFQLRAIAGTAPKNPNFEQLYFYMVDSNHDVRGNENLSPEKGKSIFLHLKKEYAFKQDSIFYEPKLSAWYLDVDDKIDLIIVNNAPLAYQYNNIDLYRTWGVAIRNRLSYKDLSLNLGVSFSGESKVLNSLEVNNKGYLYAVQVNTQLSYRIPKWHTTFATYLKYNGPQYQFAQSFVDGEQQIFKERQEGYGWLDASVHKLFLNNNLEVTIGARNILDVKSIQSTSTGGPDHNNGNKDLLLAYGTSYFFKLLYNLNF